MGMTNSYMSAATIPAVKEDLILNAWKWFNELLEKDSRQSAGAFVLIEIMQRVRTERPGLPLEPPPPPRPLTI